MNEVFHKKYLCTFKGTLKYVESFVCSSKIKDVFLFLIKYWRFKDIIKSMMRKVIRECWFPKLNVIDLDEFETCLYSRSKYGCNSNNLLNNYVSFSFSNTFCVLDWWKFLCKDSRFGNKLQIWHLWTYHWCMLCSKSKFLSSQNK
jgi:hypothetical protein